MAERLYAAWSVRLDGSLCVDCAQKAKAKCRRCSICLVTRKTPRYTQLRGFCPKVVKKMEVSKSE